MAYSFSKYYAEDVSARQLPVSGIDQEAVHRIRRQGRIERAKIVRQCFATIRRLVTAAQFGRRIS